MMRRFVPLALPALLVVLLLSQESVFAQISSHGTEFFVAFMRNRTLLNGRPSAGTGNVRLFLHVVNSSYLSRTGIQIRFPYPRERYEIFVDGVWQEAPNGSLNLLLPARAGQTIELVPDTGYTPADLQVMQSGSPERKAIRITSELPITLQAESWQQGSRGIVPVLPVHALGNDYHVITAPPTPFGKSPEGGPNELLVVAVRNNTIVNYDLPRHAIVAIGAERDTVLRGVHRDTLQAGDCLQILADSLDLTGIRVQSDNCIPFSLTAGNVAANVPARDGGTYDYLAETMLPAEMLGTEYVTTPFTTGSWDAFRIVASKDQTVVRIDGTPLATASGAVSLKRGEFITIADVAATSKGEVITNAPTRVNRHMSISSTAPVGVAQFGVSSGEPVASSSRDPFMVLLSPTVSMAGRASFSAPFAQRGYLNLLAWGDTNLLTIYGPSGLERPVHRYATWKRVPGTQFHAATINLGTVVPLDDVFHLVSKNPDSLRFHAYVYGLGGYEGYGFNAAIEFTPVAASRLRDTTICPGGTTLLSASAGDGYRWSPAEGLSCPTCKTTIAEPKQTTEYRVEIRKGCFLFYDTVRIAVSDTVRADVQDVRMCAGDTVELTPATNAGAGAIYQWSPELGLSCSDCPNPLAFPDRTTRYVLAVTSRYGCLAIDSVTVSVTDIPALNGSDARICIGDSVRLTPVRREVEGATYRWLPADGLSCTDCMDPVASPDTTTTYVLNAANDLGCSTTDTITVVVETNPVLSLRDTIVCRGGSVGLRVEGPPLANARYTWSPADGLSCTGCPDPTASPETRTTYTVTVTTGAGCVATGDVTVSVAAPPDVFTPDIAICTGESARLRVDVSPPDNVTYRWRASPDLSCLDCPDPIATPLGTTAYVVTVISATGCTTIDTARVVVRNGIEPRLTDTAVCAGESVRLDATAGGAAVGASYRWSPAEGLSCVDCPAPDASPDRTTTYVVTATSSEGCVVVDSTTVRVHPVPIIDAGINREICRGESALLSANGGISYRWAPASGLSCTDCSNPLARPEISTTYYLFAEDANGCDAVDSVRITVKDLSVEAGDDVRICIGDSVQLFSRSADSIASWSWKPSIGLSCVNCERPSASPTVTTTYALTAVGHNGCVAYDSVTVAVDPELRLTIAIPVEIAGHVNGSRTIVPVYLLDDPSERSIADLHFEFEWDSTIMMIDETSIEDGLPGTQLEGWSVSIDESRPGFLAFSLRAPAGASLGERGELLRMSARMFLGASTSTEIRQRVSSEAGCAIFDALPGDIRIDSICGLNYRLIEMVALRRGLHPVAPNPASGVVPVGFAIPFDGQTRIELFDALGARRGLLIDDVLVAGEHVVEWDTRGLGAGLYLIRLASGEWSETRSVVVTE